MAETSVSYKCPRCGAPLSFLPGRDTVSCEYCGTEFEIAAIEAQAAAEMQGHRGAAMAAAWPDPGAAFSDVQDAGVRGRQVGFALQVEP